MGFLHCFIDLLDRLIAHFLCIAHLSVLFVTLQSRFSQVSNTPIAMIYEGHTLILVIIVAVRSNE